MDSHHQKKKKVFTIRPKGQFIPNSLYIVHDPSCKWWYTVRGQLKRNKGKAIHLFATHLFYVDKNYYENSPSGVASVHAKIKRLQKGEGYDIKVRG